MALAGKVGALYRSDPTIAPIVFTDEPTTDIGDHTRYQVTDAAKRYWSKLSTVTVKVNGVIQTTGFTVEHPSGFVVFDEPKLVTDVILVSGKYLTLAQVLGVSSWKLDSEIDVEESTTFESNGSKEYTPVLTSFKGEADAFWVTAETIDVLQDAGELVCVFYVDVRVDSKMRYEGFGTVTNLKPETPVKGLVAESLSFQGTGRLFYRAG